MNVGDLVRVIRDINGYGDIARITHIHHLSVEKVVYFISTNNWFFYYQEELELVTEHAL